MSGEKIVKPNARTTGIITILYCCYRNTRLRSCGRMKMMIFQSTRTGGGKEKKKKNMKRKKFISRTRRFVTGVEH